MKTVRKGVRVYEVRYALPYQRRFHGWKSHDRRIYQKTERKGIRRDAGV